MKSLIIFDLDGTLALSKSNLDSEMATLLGRLLGTVDVAIISGGAWAQFEKQVLAFLPHDVRLKRLSLLPTCGTKFYRFDGAWKKLYSEDFSVDEKKRIIDAINTAVPEAGLKVEKHWGDLIEDRDSQITFSALGQQAPLGSTSIDVTRPGIDKAYGVRKLHETLGIAVAEMIFVGDALFPGGNDYPAEQAGAESIRVRNPHETKRVIEAICACLETNDSPRQMAA